jgi:hypothetical protein
MKVSPGLSPWSGRSYCDPEGEKWVQAFLRGMAQLGWRLGTNFQLDVRWVATDFNRTQALARELVQTQPDVIEVTSMRPPFSFDPTALPSHAGRVPCRGSQEGGAQGRPAA